MKVQVKKVSGSAPRVDARVKLMTTSGKRSTKSGKVIVYKKGV